MNSRLLNPFRPAGTVIGLIIALLSMSLSAPAFAANQKDGNTARFEKGILTISGDAQSNTVALGLDTTGNIRINDGALKIDGGRATVAETTLIEVSGMGGDDKLILDEGKGSLPAVSFLGGAGSDTFTLISGDSADTFTAAGNGKAGLRLDRGANRGAISVDGAETLALNSGAGDDQLSLGAELGTLIEVVFEGGAGKDAIAVAGSAAADLFTVTAAENRVRLDRAYPAPYWLDVAGAESLAVSTNGGSDRIATGSGIDELLALTVDQRAVGEDGADAADAITAVVASYSPASGILTVIGDGLVNNIIFTRNTAGNILINNGTLPIMGGSPTVTNTTLIRVFGQAGKDTITLSEGNGPLPRGELFAGSGYDTVTGGSGADLLDGQSGNDNLLGKGGDDILLGGTEFDILTGGDASDQVYGGGHNDRMIWNPGDDTDLNEGGDGEDTVEVNGATGPEVFTTTANGVRVRFDRLDPTPFSIDIGTSENLLVFANGGDDSFSATGNLAALIKITVNGGANNDTLLGSNGIDTLIGGDDMDFIDGQQGNDVIFLGAGDDVAQWDPGDGSDTIEGEAGSDTMLFNGSAGNENFGAAEDTGRMRFTRNLGNIVMSLDDVESIDLNAFGGTDNIVVNDLSRTDLVEFNANLAVPAGGGDVLTDTITVNATENDEFIELGGSVANPRVLGLYTQISITGADAASDSLRINSLLGDDTVDAQNLPTGSIIYSADGGVNDDVLIGSANADTLLGNDGDDVLMGGPGVDVLDGGSGTNIIIQD